MKLAELLSGIEIIEGCYDPELEVTGVSYDSRETKPGQAFVAIPGFASDGYRFIPKALERGAGVIICEREPEQKAQYVQVADCRKALARLGANWFGHPADKMTMLGVTGTNGKTTITYLLKTVLEKTLGAKVGLIGTIQNMIGGTVIHTERTTPESFELQKLFSEMVDAGCTHCVMEVSSHALVLHRADEITFETGIFTNLTEDHLDFHKTMDAYCEAKAMLFSRCKHGVVNTDDAYAQKIMEHATCDVLRYAEKDPDAELRAENIALHAGSVEFMAKTRDAQADIQLTIPGGFTVYNALAAVTAALLLKIPPETIQAQISGFQNTGMRQKIYERDGFTIIEDCYNAGPESTEAALDILAGFRARAKGRCIAVLGDMLELGNRSAAEHYRIGRIAAAKVDMLYTYGTNSERMVSGAITGGMKQKFVEHFDTHEDLAHMLKMRARPGDVILFKGSRGMRMEKALALFFKEEEE